MTTEGDAQVSSRGCGAVTRAFVATVRPEHAHTYVSLHANPWPEIIALLQAASLIDYRIFLDETRCLLFAQWTYTGQNLEADLTALRKNPIAHEWNIATLNCMVPVGDGTDAWTEIAPIFVLK